MRNPRLKWSHLTSLRMRLAVLLSIAVLPLGIVAVLQTAAVVSEAQRLERSDMLARTLRAVNEERALLRRAYGSAEALGTTAVSVGTSNPICGQIMRSFVSERDGILFAGFIDADGILRCSSTGEIIDFNGFGDWQSFAAAPRPMMSFNPDGAATGEPVLIATMPVFEDGDGRLAGAASLSLPGGVLDAALEPEFDGVTLALLDSDGAVLAATDGTDRIAHFGLVPSDLPITDGGYTEDITSGDGPIELAVLVPLIEDRIYVLGIWEGQTHALSISLFGTSAPLFPILMWLIALGVGTYAIDRLVLRHLNQLRARMAGFSLDSPGDNFVTLDHAPREITQIANTYNMMIDRILGDQRELADALGEKELLLREVHHRVKNNLQLIASMINIQIRSVPEGPSRLILRRMQDRVMGLSAIHKALYSDNTLARVRADRLLQEVLQSTISIGLPVRSGVETQMQFDALSLDPDQAVPLTLLASELTTNAVKYVGRPETGPASIHVTLEKSGDDVRLVIENTVGAALQPSDATEGTGLGAQLIAAFVSQLGGEMKQEADDTHYAVAVTCPGLLTETPEDSDDTDEDDDRVTVLPRAS